MRTGHWKESSVRSERFPRLHLFVAHHSGGHSYQWEDGDGRVWCSGWEAIDVERRALDHLENGSISGSGGTYV